MFTGANQTIEVKLGAAGALPWTAEAIDTAMVVTPTNGVTNGTTGVAVVAASKGFLKSLMLRNNDAVVHSLTIQLNDNSTLRPIVNISLAVGDMVLYDAASGWKVLDASGKLKSLSSGDWLVNADGSVTLLNRAARCSTATLTYSATVTPDFAVANNFIITLTGGVTLANPSNMLPGQTGGFYIKQDASGGHTLACGSYYDFIGGTIPTLSTAANAKDYIPYTVPEANVIILGNALLDCK